jgi:primase-polymerase (primpol)-like protein
MRCLVCKQHFEQAATGRPRQFCSGKCRVKNHRTRNFPTEIINLDRWIRHHRKRPITIGGYGASVTKPEHWSSYEQARQCHFGDGLGFVLNGDALVCVDLDDCLIDGEPTKQAQAILDQLGESYTEYSPSGRGLHVWGYASLSKGRVENFDNQRIEIYPSGRYITVTERPLVKTKLNRLNL